LNEEQRIAAVKALSGQDYTLILGMPGTGKTSTIEFVVRCFIAMGKRVLVSSYTHAAVDNILAKLLDSNVAARCVVRLCSPSSFTSVDPRVRGRCLDREAKGGCRAQLGVARVVGCTCRMAATDGLMFKLRTFDVAVLDEAGQITQPMALAPLMRANAFVLVGDPHQLAPLVQSKVATARGMAVSLFQRLFEAHSWSVAALSKQYRMNEAIMDLCNAALDGAFLTDISKENRKPPGPKVEGAIVACGGEGPRVYARRLACGSETVARATLTLQPTQCGPASAAQQIGTWANGSGQRDG